MRIPSSDSPLVVLDTDVLSFHLDQDPVRVPRYARHVEGKVACISFVSTAELRFGAKRRGWGERRSANLEAFIGLYWIIESDPGISKFWAQVRSEGMRTGFNIDKQDAWIAAVALHLMVPLITHNAGDFEHVAGLEVITEPDRV